MSKKNESVANVETAVVEQKKFDVPALFEKMKTKSAVVRFLDSEGLKRGEIAKLLNIRYQHVRNILVTPLKKTEEVSAS
jgi:hypothetical protein